MDNRVQSAWLVTPPSLLDSPVNVLSHLGHAQLCVALWPVAHQVPLSMGSPGKNTGVGCHALLQEVFLTLGLNLLLLRLLHWQAERLLTARATWEAPSQF